MASPVKKLVVYLTAGDPSCTQTAEIICAAATAGADVIELGIPFSDPSADGPAIEAAMERALHRGTSLPSVLEIVADIRRRGCEVPVVLFGYANPIFVWGTERFAASAAQAGADAVLVVDWPVPGGQGDHTRRPSVGALAGALDDTAKPSVDYDYTLAQATRAAGLDLVPLLAPTSPPSRIAEVSRLEAPFVYYISMTGVTGKTLGDPASLANRIAELRSIIRAPIAVGFGITTPDDARGVARHADAVVVGSAIVRTIEENPGNESRAVASLVRELKRAVLAVY